MQKAIYINIKMKSNDDMESYKKLKGRGNISITDYINYIN